MNFILEKLRFKLKSEFKIILTLLNHDFYAVVTENSCFSFLTLFARHFMQQISVHLTVGHITDTRIERLSVEDLNVLRRGHHD